MDADNPGILSEIFDVVLSNIKYTNKYKIHIDFNY